MKHSIRTRIALSLTFTIIFTLLITWTVNRTFLPYYYIHSKMDKLNEAYDKIAHLINHSEEDLNLTSYEHLKIQQIELLYDVHAYILNSPKLFLQVTPDDNSAFTLYPANEMGRREELKIRDMFLEYFGFTNPNNEGKKLLSEKNNYFVYKLHDRELDSNYIDLIGIIDGNTDTKEKIDHTQKIENSSYVLTKGPDDKIILIRSNVESIEEGVAIANEFLAYVGVFAVVIGTIAMFIISKRFTKPILVLADIAKKMSEMNFEVKYQINSKDEIGELGKSINTLSDELESKISELKQANNELITDIQRKIEIDEMRKEFLSNVSHELKTPISLIQGYAEGLKENINEDALSREFYCEVIIDESYKMNQMVKKLLSLNELEFGTNQVNYERFDIIALIRSVLDSADILFKQKNVSLYFQDNEQIYVWADEFLIQQVVSNYISNALNHVDDKKVIEVKVIPRGDSLRVAVFNTGENIPEEELDKIWVKFYKIDKARTREYGGNGIGLSIVKAIMNSHNKEYGVMNRPIGVEFWFELDMNL